MRLAPATLLVLAACRPAHDPESIRRALAKTPIDVAALEEAFRLPPRALLLHAPRLPEVSTRAPQVPWTLENASSRPVWLRTSSLRVKVETSLFLPDRRPAGYRLGGRARAIPRPAFKPEEWTLLWPGDQVPLVFETTGWTPGDLRLSAAVQDDGAALVHGAREFNAKRGLSWNPVALATAARATLLLPSSDWEGSPWHGDHEIDPLPLPGGRWEWRTRETPDRLDALPLEAFVVDGVGICIARGNLVVESVGDDDGPSRRTVYALPRPLPSGAYQLLLRAEDAAGYFLDGHRHSCDAIDGAASRWIPFRIE
jgi:hypothetical protein